MDSEGEHKQPLLIIEESKAEDENRKKDEEPVGCVQPDEDFQATLAKAWEGVLKGKVASGEPVNPNYVKNLGSVSPLLVEAIQALLKALEEEKMGENNNAYTPDEEKIHPLRWLSSYLLRHNPKHSQDNKPVNPVYNDHVKSALE